MVAVEPWQHIAWVWEQLPGSRANGAPIVIYPMATSSPNDTPRGVSFLYGWNRLNVASAGAAHASYGHRQAAAATAAKRRGRCSQRLAPVCRAGGVAMPIVLFSGFPLSAINRV